MSIPIRSQHRPPHMFQDRATADSRQLAPSRIPTEYSNNVGQPSSKRAQHIPRLARISSQRETIPDSAAAQRHGSKHTAHGPATAASQDAREALVSPHSRAASSAQYQTPAKPYRDSSTSSDYPDTLAVLWLVRSDLGQPTVARPAKEAVDHRLLHSASARARPQDRCGPCDHAQS